MLELIITHPGVLSPQGVKTIMNIGSQSQKSKTANKNEMVRTGQKEKPVDIFNLTFVEDHLLNPTA